MYDFVKIITFSGEVCKSRNVKAKESHNCITSTVYLKDHKIDSDHNSLNFNKNHFGTSLF